LRAKRHPEVSGQRGRKRKACGMRDTFLLHMPVDNRVRYDLFEALELAYDKRAVCCPGDELQSRRLGADPSFTPWTSIRDVEMISPLLGRKLGARPFRYEVPERRDLPVELAGLLVCPFGDVLVFRFILEWKGPIGKMLV
jgi:hypothetical protein